MTTHHTQELIYDTLETRLGIRECLRCTALMRVRATVRGIGTKYRILMLMQSSLLAVTQWQYTCALSSMMV